MKNDDPTRPLKPYKDMDESMDSCLEMYSDRDNSLVSLWTP
jgi:hypothetical protein